MKKNEFKLNKVSVRLVADAPVYSEKKITSPEDAIEILGNELRELDREVIAVINLKQDGTPINCTIASMGALEHAIASPRELLKASVLSNAAAMILMHNHPSGSITASKEDVMITKRMYEICNMIGIPLRDHIIVSAGKTGYFSFQANNLLDAPKTFNITSETKRAGR